MLLSIGLIVKNEEKHLERCLKALQPLNKRIEYEIVIVDTGSTDRTKEIAYKYTDKVYDFEWINDFAAARNYGLNKCEGKWFLFLDADEEIDDCEPLIEFLLNPENDKYKTVTFHFKNYLSKDKKTIENAELPRMFKNNNIQFTGKIHETINIDRPLYALRCTVNHYGYIDVLDKKYERNDRIINELLDNNPGNLNYLKYKIKSLIHNKENEEIIEIYRKYVEPITKIDNSFYADYYRITNDVIKIYLEQDNIDKAKMLLNKLNAIYNSIDIVMIETYFLFIYFWFQKNRKSLYNDTDIEKYGLEYLKLYKKYEKNNYDDFYYTWFGLDVNKNKYSVVLNTLANYYYYKKDYKKMYINLNKLYFKDSNDIPYDLEFKFIKEIKNYDRIVEVYEYCKELELIKDFFEKVQSIKEDDDFYQELIKVLVSNASSIESPYKEYYQFLVDKENTVLITALREFEEMPDCLSDIIYYLMKNNVYVDDFKWLNKPCKSKNYALNLMTYHYDVCQVVLAYIKEIEETPHKRILGFYVSLIYYVLVADQELSNEEYMYLLETLVSWQMESAKGLYKDSLFTANEIDFLPERVKYCYYMNNAIELINDGSYKEALTSVKLAMKQDEKLIKGCRLLLEQIEEKQNEPAPMSEFVQYARKVKDAIIGLINVGKKDEAINLYKQYKTVNPKDTELDKYFN